MYHQKKGVISVTACHQRWRWCYNLTLAQLFKALPSVSIDTNPTNLKSSKYLVVPLKAERTVLMCLACYPGLQEFPLLLHSKC